MGISIEWSMTQNAWDKRVCEDYWAYNNKMSYVDYVHLLCQKYSISAHTLFDTVSQCYACIDDVCCEYCGSACPIEVPADIAYMRAKESWFCAVCEHAREFPKLCVTAYNPLTGE